MAFRERRHRLSYLGEVRVIEIGRAAKTPVWRLTISSLPFGFTKLGKF